MWCGTSGTVSALAAKCAGVPWQASLMGRAHEDASPAPQLHRARLLVVCERGLRAALPQVPHPDGGVVAARYDLQKGGGDGRARRTGFIKTGCVQRRPRFRVQGALTQTSATQVGHAPGGQSPAPRWPPPCSCAQSAQTPVPAVRDVEGEHCKTERCRGEGETLDMHSSGAFEDSRSRNPGKYEIS